jgi:hypothetical protein
MTSLPFAALSGPIPPNGGISPLHPEVHGV